MGGWLLGGFGLGWGVGCSGRPSRLSSPVALALALSRCCRVFGGEGKRLWRSMRQGLFSLVSRVRGNDVGLAGMTWRVRRRWWVLEVLAAGFWICMDGRDERDVLFESRDVNDVNDGCLLDLTGELIVALMLFPGSAV